MESTQRQESHPVGTTRIPQLSPVLMTPELAKKQFLPMIQEEDQRRLRQSHVNRYARNMLSGKFDGLNGETLKVDTNGSLIDGQHRIHAVIKAGVAVPMLVMYGLPKVAKKTIDSGIIRTKFDLLGYEGIKFPKSVASIISMMAGKGTIGAVDRENVVELARKHSDALEFVLTAFGRNVRSVTTAPVKGIVARAFYTADRTRLRQFVEVLVSGVTQSQDDTAAILLRNWLLLNRSARSGSAVLEVYQKTQRALKAFLNREGVSRLYREKEELFPIPS